MFQYIHGCHKEQHEYSEELKGVWDPCGVVIHYYVTPLYFDAFVARVSIYLLYVCIFSSSTELLFISVNKYILP